VRGSCHSGAMALRFATLGKVHLALLVAPSVVFAVVAGCGSAGDEGNGEDGAADLSSKKDGAGGSNGDDDGSVSGDFDGSIIPYDPAKEPDASKPLTPPPPPPDVNALTGNFISRAETASGIVDPNTQTYMYAPKLIYADGAYHFWACWGVAGDYIGYKSAPTLAGLAGAPMTAALRPSGNEVHTCDPSVVRGDDGLWYLHYTHAHGAKAAVSPNPGGPYIKYQNDILANAANIAPGQYGRGQTSVTRGADGNYYMSFTNLILPVEPNSVVVLKSSTPSFASFTEVTRFDSSLIDKGAYTTDLTYDPFMHRFLFTEGRPDGWSAEWITGFDDAFKLVSQMRLPINTNTGLPSEGQSLLTDSNGRVLTEAPGVHNSLLIASSTWGAARSNFPLHITGPAVWKMYPAFRNLAEVSNFEAGSSGFAPWPGSNVTTYTNEGIALEGKSYLATNAGTAAAGTGGAFRDISWPMFAGSSYRAVMYVRAQDAGGASGRACVWMLGGSPNESTCENYTVTNSAWQMIDLPVNPAGDHDTFRIQVYAGEGTTFVDAASLSSSIVSTGFEKDAGGFVPMSGSNLVTYKASAIEGASLLATNSGTTPSGGGSYRDIESFSVPGVPHTLTMYLRAQDAAGATGQVCLWALGVSANESACAPYTVTQGEWKFASVTLTPKDQHSAFRIQLYTGAGTTFVDAVSLR